jgi:methionyl-tRNA formyltransferase
VIGADREHGLLVRTGLGVLAVQRLQLEFKKPLDWRAFLNGNPRILGARLGQG